MKKLNIVSIEGHGYYGSADVFLDSELNIIGIVESNDGNWRHEYFNPILKNIEVEVCKLKQSDVPDFEEKIKKY